MSGFSVVNGVTENPLFNIYSVDHDSGTQAPEQLNGGPTGARCFSLNSVVDVEGAA